MAETPNYNLRYPVGTDPVDVAGDLERLALDADSALGSINVDDEGHVDFSDSTQPLSLVGTGRPDGLGTGIYASAIDAPTGSTFTNISPVEHDDGNNDTFFGNFGSVRWVKTEQANMGLSSWIVTAGQCRTRLHQLPGGDSIFAESQVMEVWRWPTLGQVNMWTYQQAAAFPDIAWGTNWAASGGGGVQRHGIGVWSNGNVTGQIWSRTSAYASAPAETIMGSGGTLTAPEVGDTKYWWFAQAPSFHHTRWGNVTTNQNAAAWPCGPINRLEVIGTTYSEEEHGDWEVRSMNDG